MGFGEVAEQLRRSTVLIQAGGSGSGVIWSTDGIIVTNAHVARGSQAGVQLWDGRELEAKIMSRNLRRDIALLRVNAKNLPAAVAADSSEVRPGELTIAIGNPLGFIGALTTGTVHAIGPLRGLGPQSWIQACLRLHRAILAGRSRTRAVELSGSTRWLRADSHSRFRVTR